VLEQGKSKKCFRAISIGIRSKEQNLLSLLLSKEVREFLVRTLGEFSGFPEIRSQETVSVTNGSESSLDKVTESTGRTTRGGITIGDTSQLEDTLGSGRGNDTSTTGSRDQTRHNGTTTTRNLARNGVRLTKVGTPVTTTNGDDSELSEDDTTTNSSSNFLGTLDTQTDMTVFITNDNESLETGTLTSSGLLLNRHDLHDLISELGEEIIDDLILLDRKREEVDFFDRLDLVSLDETTKLGDRNPFVLVVVTTSTTTSTTTRSTTTTSKTTSYKKSIF
jgi:hypothetical protein